MPIEGFDYKSFSEELAKQAGGLVPKDLQDFQKNYIIKTIKNFATLSAEAVANDDKLGFNADQAMLITQIIAEWSFHKSIDIIRSGILPDYWDGIMQKIAFTIFEISKQAISQNIDQDEVLKIVEHHVKKSYEKAISELKERGMIDDETLNSAMGQSNIDAMMQEMQQEQIAAEDQAAPAGETQQAKDRKILKLASVALLMKHLNQDKVMTILNRIEPLDAQMVLQYMNMKDLEDVIDKGIAMKCLTEIKSNLPTVKKVNPNKLYEHIRSVLVSVPKEKLVKTISKERPVLNKIVANVLDGEPVSTPPKVLSVIAQHLEESLV